MMDTLDAQRVISKYRGDAVVVPTMSAHYEWPQVSTKAELDFGFSVMGKASSIALGLALGRPDKKVFLFDGDGSLLMNMGNLVTIANMAPVNLIYFLIDNGCYRCCEPGDDVPGSGKTDFARIVQGAGFIQVHAFEDLESLDKAMSGIMAKPGPAFVWLKCEKNRGIPKFPYVEPREYVDQFIEALKNV
jgi:thiamine pyrophosphate-dependent acetolactate synthase large subunit-like protein